MTASQNTLPHVVIIGGGFGGLLAAKSLKKAPVRVTLIDRTNHHLFQPLLYQVAMAGLAPSEIAMPIRSVLRRQKNTRVILAEVLRVDLEKRRIFTAEDRDRPMGYDYLVIAAGAENHYFGHDEWATHAVGLKDLEDAVEIRRRVLLAFEAAEREDDESKRAALTTFAVIGAGPTGVELAGSLAELSRRTLIRDFRNIRPASARVVLIEAGDRVLAPFDARLSESAAEQLESLGVELRLGAKVTKIDEAGVHIGDGEVLRSRTVLWGAGVKPNQLGQTLGTPLDKRGRIIVERDCSLPGHPEVFAIGDIAAFVPEGANEALPGLCPVAMQQGRYVGDAIKRSIAKRKREPFEYFDKGIMATIGRSRAVAQTGALRLTGLIAFFAWLFVHILYLIGFRNRLLVMLEWFWAYLFYRRGARLITGDRRHAGAPGSSSRMSLDAISESDSSFDVGSSDPGNVSAAGAAKT